MSKNYKNNNMASNEIIEISPDSSDKSVDSQGFPVLDFLDDKYNVKPTDNTIDLSDENKENVHDITLDFMNTSISKEVVKQTCSYTTEMTLSSSSKRVKFEDDEITPPTRGAFNGKTPFKETTSTTTLVKFGLNGERRNFLNNNGTYRPSPKIDNPKVIIKMTGTKEEIKRSDFYQIKSEVLAGGAIGVKAFDSFKLDVIKAKNDAEFFKIDASKKAKKIDDLNRYIKIQEARYQNEESDMDRWKQELLNGTRGALLEILHDLFKNGEIDQSFKNKLTEIYDKKIHDGKFHVGMKDFIEYIDNKEPKEYSRDEVVDFVSKIDNNYIREIENE